MMRSTARTPIDLVEGKNKEHNSTEKHLNNLIKTLKQKRPMDWMYWKPNRYSISLMLGFIVLFMIDYTVGPRMLTWLSLIWFPVVLIMFEIDQILPDFIPAMTDSYNVVFATEFGMVILSILSVLLLYVFSTAMVRTFQEWRQGNINWKAVFASYSLFSIFYFSVIVFFATVNSAAVVGVMAIIWIVTTALLMRFRDSQRSEQV